MKRLLLTIAAILAALRLAQTQPVPPPVTTTPTPSAIPAPVISAPARWPDGGLIANPTATCAVPPEWPTPAPYPAAYP